MSCPTKFSISYLDEVNGVKRYRITSFAGREYILFLTVTNTTTSDLSQLRLETGITFATATEAKNKLASSGWDKNSVEVYAKGINVVKTCKCTLSDPKFELTAMLMSRMADAIVASLEPAVD